MKDSEEFQDVAWNGDENNTKGYRIVEAVINYYDSWKDINDDDSYIGVNRVYIGEIRTGRSGNYVLTKVSYATENDTVDKNEIVYITDIVNKWGLTSYENYTGYVSLDYINKIT